MRVSIADQAIAELSEAWRYCVGTGRLNLGLRQDYLESLRVVQREIGFGYLRGHGLFHDDLGIHRPYDEAGHRGVRHNFSYLDQVFDSWLELGIRPFVELGFMPSGLASGDRTVFWWRGNITPPRDEDEWVRLVTATVTHLVDRYGVDEVRTWPIEVWNEPNLPQFWLDADQDAYFRLYELSVTAVKQVDAGLQVGGPAISPGADEWWAPFAEFVTRRNLPVDFVSRHAYSSGPSNHVPFGTYQTLMPPASLLDQFAAPRRHLEGTALAGLPAHITEFNTSYRPDNPVHDTAYNAAYLAAVLARGGDLVDSFSYWTFCDVFEEVGIPTSILHGGFGLLGHRQLRKPTFHLYAFMARLGREVLARGDDHLVTRHPDGRLAILAWQPVDGTNPGAERHTIQLSLPIRPGASRLLASLGPQPPGGGSLSGVGPQPPGRALRSGLGPQPAGGAPPGGPVPEVARNERVSKGRPAVAAYLHRQRVNEDEGNVFTAWQQLGRPHSPTSRQLDLLHEASHPAVEHAMLAVTDGRLELDLHLARHEVTLVELDPVHDETEPWIDDRRIPGYRESR